MYAYLQEAGFGKIDIFVSPAPYKHTTTWAQLKEAVDYIKYHDQKFRNVWIEVRGSDNWGKCIDNYAFLKDMVSGGEKLLGLKLGILTSESDWNSIMCSSTDFSHLPLWYSENDYNTSLSGFKPFGGWTKPSLKQYSVTTNLCGASIGEDSY